MDDREFDRVARAVAAGRTRRAVVRTLAGGAAGGLLALLGRGEAGANACRGTGKTCKRGRQCCSGNCAPPPSGGGSTGGSKSICCAAGQERHAATGACCTRTCAGKACGADDGCGGVCQTGSCNGVCCGENCCAEGQICNYTFLQCTGCVGEGAFCDVRFTGCCAGFVCSDNVCVPA